MYCSKVLYICISDISLSYTGYHAHTAPITANLYLTFSRGAPVIIAIIKQYRLFDFRYRGFFWIFKKT